MIHMEFMTHLVLREHKFRHNFADTLNPLCSCSFETEDTEHTFYAAKITYHFAQPLRMI